MTEFIELPSELILEIITKFLGFYDSINLVQTCKTLYKFHESKAFWHHLAICAPKSRPTPVPKDWRNMELEEIRDISINSRRLSTFLSQKTMPRPRRIWTLTPPAPEAQSTTIESTKGNDGSQEDDSITPDDPQLWVWLLRDGKHLMSMSKSGILRVWNIASSKIVGHIQIVGKPLCWDYTVDDEGVTIIVNVDCSDQPGDMFRVWRMPWSTGEATLLLERHLLGNIRSNYIEGTITGCVSINDSNEVFIYVADWVSLAEAYITTPIGLPENLSAATNPRDLALYAEDSTRAVFYAYHLEDLSQLLTTPMSRHQLAPSVWRYFEYSGKPIEGAGLWIPTCRTLWDGRVGVFSRSITFDLEPSDQYLVSLSIPDMRTEDQSPNPRGFDYVWASTDRLVLRVTAESGMVESPENWDICTMGMYGKTAVWLEYNIGSDPDAEGYDRLGKIYFADFPVRQDVAKPLKKSEDSDDDDDSWVTASGGDGNNENAVDGAAVGDPSPLESPQDSIEEDSQPEHPSGSSQDLHEITISLSTQQYHHIEDDQYQPTLYSQEQHQGHSHAQPQSPVQAPETEAPSSSVQPSLSSPSSHSSDSPPEPVVETISPSNVATPSTPVVEPGTTSTSGLEQAPTPESEPDQSVTPPVPALPRAPAEYGHFCVYDMTEDWRGKGQEYNNVFSVDFDDARGRLVFATGSGKLVLYEFV